MGSFAFTCCVSGLPIEYGDPVRYFLLTQNPYNQAAENCCYIHDRWVPRTFPLRAKYNDYGSVEKLQEGVQQKLWFEGFDVDLVKRGVGENTCHDVPVRKNMSLEMLLTALWEGRVLVKDLQGVRVKKGDIPEPKVQAGIPTTNRISEVIQKAGLKLTDGNFAEGYKVSLQRRGVVRVRYEEFNRETQLKALEKLQTHLGEYASMITVGEEPYQGDSELIVAPKPARYEHFSRRKLVTHRRLAVAQAMIREDVWQALTKRTYDSWKGQYKVEDFLKSIKEALVTVRQFFEDSPDFPPHLVIGGNDLSTLTTKDLVPFVVGLGYHFRIMARKKDVLDEEMEDFLQTAAEFSFIHAHLASVRYMWSPSSSNGPQFGEWDKHADFLGMLKYIADQKWAEQKEEEEAD
jgi:hypothetical protein